MFHKMVRLTCFRKRRAGHALKNGVLGVLRKMACLKFLSCFLGTFDHEAFVNCSS